MFLGRVVGPGEPQWLEEDRVKAVEYRRYERSLCNGCGRHFDDTTAVDDDLEPRHQYRAEPIVCHACAERSATERAFTRDQDASVGDGLHFRIHEETHG